MAEDDFYFIFDMLCKSVYSIEWAKKISRHSHLAPYRAILVIFAPFGPCSWAPYGSAHLVCRSFDRVDDFTYQKIKNKSAPTITSYAHLKVRPETLVKASRKREIHFLTKIHSHQEEFLGHNGVGKFGYIATSPNF